MNAEVVLPFTEEEVGHMLANLDKFNPDEVEELNRIVDELAARNAATKSMMDLITFCLAMMPEYIVGKHHRILAQELMYIEEGSKDRICVNIPPRHGKSQLVSISVSISFIISINFSLVFICGYFGF